MPCPPVGSPSMATAPAYRNPLTKHKKELHNHEVLATEREPEGQAKRSAAKPASAGNNSFDTSLSNYRAPRGFACLLLCVSA